MLASLTHTKGAALTQAHKFKLIQPTLTRCTERNGNSALKEVRGLYHMAAKENIRK